MRDAGHSRTRHRHALKLAPTLILFLTLCARQQSAGAQTLYDMDLDLLRAIESNNSWPWLDVPVELFSLATPFVEGGLTIGQYVVGRRSGRRYAVESAAVAASGIITAQVVVVGLKYLIHRPRPPRGTDSYKPRIWHSRATPSFPSGHAAMSFAFAVGFGHAYPRWRYWLLAYAAASGVSQMYVGNHYPSDVLAGAILGYAVSTLIWREQDRVLCILKQVNVVMLDTPQGWQIAATIAIGP